MYLIQFPNNFSSLDKTIQKYLIALSELLIPHKEHYSIYNATIFMDRVTKVFRNLNYKAQEFKIIGLTDYEDYILLMQGLDLFKFDGYYYIPSEFLANVDDINNTNSTPIISEYLDKVDLSKLFEKFLLKYKSNILNKTINKDSSLPIKSIVDKQAMFALIYHWYSPNIYVSKSCFKINTSSYCINPNFSKLFGLKQLKTQEILNLLDIPLETLIKYMKKFKKLNYNLIIGGFGGAMTNFCFWLEEFSKLTNILYPVESTIIYEFDTLDFGNLETNIPLNEAEILFNRIEVK